MKEIWPRLTSKLASLLVWPHGSLVILHGPIFSFIVLPTAHIPTLCSQATPFTSPKMSTFPAQFSCPRLGNSPHKHSQLTIPSGPYSDPTLKDLSRSKSPTHLFSCTSHSYEGLYHS
jgi:hypothetical protein